MKQRVEKWRPFGHSDGDIRDLSFPDTHQAVCAQHHEGKEPLEYRSWAAYSLRCSIEDYEHQTNGEEQPLMYHAPKESRLFCQYRYSLVHTHLERTISALPESNVIHTGYGSCAVTEVSLDGGDKASYFATFRAFREGKKLRLHVTSAHPISEEQKGKSAKLFTIAYNLLRNKQLPQSSK